MDRLTRTLLAANARYVRALTAVRGGYPEQMKFLASEGVHVPEQPTSLSEYIDMAEAVCHQALMVSVSEVEAPSDDLHLMQYMLSRFGDHRPECYSKFPHSGGACDCGWALTYMALPRIYTELEMLPAEPEVEDAATN